MKDHTKPHDILRFMTVNTAVLLSKIYFGPCEFYFGNHCAKVLIHFMYVCVQQLAMKKQINN